MALVDKVPWCSYYGRLHGKLYGDNVGTFIVDEAFQRLLIKYEEHLRESTDKLIKEVKAAFNEKENKRNKLMEIINQRITEIEKKIDKGNKKKNDSK